MEGSKQIVCRCLTKAFGGGAETSTVLWPAGRHLANFFCDRPSLLEGRRVVELGTGCGTVGIAVRTHAAIQATDVLRCCLVAQLTTSHLPRFCDLFLFTTTNATSRG